MKTLKTTLVIASLLLLSGCMEKTSQENLVEEGYKNIVLDGMSWDWRCGKSSVLNVKFKATNPQGKQVTGSVCKTLFGLILKD